ncbi:hypothetical protein GCM10007913_25990 [Devosia yakushimensis]|uniref:Uncharacterized protein n=1 Tax=Devosia yakushimensis TaxID=470028 RepID=A0ABQ5UF05_9HYPH|nr:hypothetical protein [Devosia yakushimensis]GLQ10667.1 hypothetical protein GCM10007913_25990 [Devosia yakushimensis]
MTVLLIHSHYGAAPQGYAADPGVLVVRERELTAGHFAAATGLLTTTHLDQIGLLQHQPALQALLDRGGRWFFNGHILREFVEGLGRYVPLHQPRRADLAMTRLFEHPIFVGIEQRSLEENKGVAGFYGRGHNPLPDGAQAVNGIGPNLVPIDWDWALPAGGRMFSHAGNDLGGMGGESGDGALLTRRIIAWCRGELP